MIGAGMRVDGAIAFSGVLRIQGEMVGEIACDADGTTLVVDKSGSVAGTVRAPHVLIAGQIAGPVHSSASIEIQPGAQLTGDVWYRELSIQPGGIIDGALHHSGPHDETAAPRPAPRPGDTAAAGPRVRSPSIRRRSLVVAIALLVTAIAAGLVLRSPAPPVPPDTAPTPPIVKAEPATPAPAPVPPAATSASATESRTVVTAGTEAEKPTPVQGVNPGKPGGIFSVSSREAAVLMRKKRNDPGEGSRIDITPGTSESITIGRNDIFRVVQGRDIAIFYQGRKLAPKLIESGVWIAFVPQTEGSASEAR